MDFFYDFFRPRNSDFLKEKENFRVNEFKIIAAVEQLLLSIGR